MTFHHTSESLRQALLPEPFMPQLEILTITSLSVLIKALDNSKHHVSADHEGLHVFELYEALAFYKKNGYRIFDIDNETSAFVSKGKETVRLVTGHIKPFTAYRVLDAEAITFLEKGLSLRSIPGGQFEVRPHRLDTNDYKCLILRHIITNDLIRFYWKREKKVKDPIVKLEEEPPDESGPQGDNDNPVPLSPHPEPPVLEDAANMPEE